MKTTILFFLLSLVIATNSCKDKNNDSDIFQPSLDLDEYVLMNVNGTERIFTTDNDISVREEIDTDGDKKMYISLNPVPQSYTNFFLNIDDPAVGDFTGDQVEINYLDYSFDDSFPMIQLACYSTECEKEISLTIHELGGVGEKMIGEMSGTISSDNGATNQFSGEFVVYRDQ